MEFNLLTFIIWKSTYDYLWTTQNKKEYKYAYVEESTIWWFMHIWFSTITTMYLNRSEDKWHGNTHGAYSRLGRRSCSRRSVVVKSSKSFYMATMWKGNKHNNILFEPRTLPLICVWPWGKIISYFLRYNVILSKISYDWMDRT